MKAFSVGFSMAMAVSVGAGLAMLPADVRFGPHFLTVTAVWMPWFMWWLYVVLVRQRVVVGDRRVTVVNLFRSRTLDYRELRAASQWRGVVSLHLRNGTSIGCGAFGWGEDPKPDRNAESLVADVNACARRSSRRFVSYPGAASRWRVDAHPVAMSVAIVVPIAATSAVFARLFGD